MGEYEVFTEFFEQLTEDDIEEFTDDDYDMCIKILLAMEKWDKRNIIAT